MDLYSKYLELTPMASFTVIYLNNQIYGEVDPVFVKEYGEELPPTWSFIDYKNTMHSVTFNMSSIRPLLTVGWREMKEIFGFTVNQEVDFLYYGKGVFGLMCSKPLECHCQIPVYHSRFTKIGYTIEFYIDVTSHNISKPFVSVFDSFEEYLRSCHFEFIIVCCDNGSMHSFDIAHTDEPFRTTSIGLGWNDFCVTGGFIVGDLLCFKFTTYNHSNIAYVYKLNQ